MIAPTWLDDLRLQAGPPFVNMGIHALDLDRWLTVDDDREEDLGYRSRLLDTKRSIVFAALDDTDAPSNEVLLLIRSWLVAHHVVAGESNRDEHPLMQAARLVQEDLAIMQRIDGLWVLTAGAVCFPSHWTIADRVGLPLDGVHVPVAHYETELSERVDRFHDRLTPDRPVWRRNWAVNATNELHLPAFGYPMHPVETIEADGSPMFIRSEYQTLRRLPETDAIVFTIRIQRTPLGALRGRPDLARKMLHTISSWDGPKRRYASTGGAIEALVGWLSDVVVSREAAC